MKRLKLIEKGIILDDQMNHIVGGSKCNNLVATPGCPGHLVFDWCYVKHVCPVYSDGGNTCNNFIWREESPISIPTDTISTDTIQRP